MPIPNSTFRLRRNTIQLGAISGDPMGCPHVDSELAFSTKKECDSPWRDFGRGHGVPPMSIPSSTKRIRLKLAKNRVYTKDS